MRVFHESPLILLYVRCTRRFLRYDHGKNKKSARPFAPNCVIFSTVGSTSCVQYDVFELSDIKMSNIKKIISHKK
jgi:hypothetical protein